VQHYNEYKAIIKSIFGELTPENKKRLEEKIKEQQEKAKAESLAFDQQNTADSASL